MTSQMACRPEWQIDKRLNLLIGENIRVRVSAFCPPKWNGEPANVIQAANLMLPDNSMVHRDELYFEGKLLSYRRDVAFVFLALDQSAFAGEGANGRVLYRGRQAVILHGPATVQLHPDHFIEKLPSDSSFYWDHLRIVGPQFEFSFKF